MARAAGRLTIAAVPDERASRLSSVLDGMVARNRERIGALDVGDRLRTRPGSAQAGPAGAPAGAIPAIQLDAAVSAAARLLDARFGHRWHHEITARPREGDEAVVVCKVFVDDLGAVQTQLGRAPIVEPIAGSAGGVSFRLGSLAGAEADAYRRAAEAALTRCAERLALPSGQP